MASGRLIDYLGAGLGVDRPAAPDIPDDGISLYLATDDLVLGIWDVNGATWHDFDLTGVISTLIQLTDFPSAYAGHAGKQLMVKGDESGVEFAAGISQEAVQDWVAGLITNGAGITVTYDDGAGTLTIANTVSQYTDEMARDALGAALTQGTGITITPNDGGDSITIACTITQYTDTMVNTVIDSRFVTLTQTAYDALAVKDPNVFYFITA